MLLEIHEEKKCREICRYAFVSGSIFSGSGDGDKKSSIFILIASVWILFVFNLDYISNHISQQKSVVIVKLCMPFHFEGCSLQLFNWILEPTGYCIHMCAFAVLLIWISSVAAAANPEFGDLKSIKTEMDQLYFGIIISLSLTSHHTQSSLSVPIRCTYWTLNYCPISICVEFISKTDTKYSYIETTNFHT